MTARPVSPAGLSWSRRLAEAPRWQRLARSGPGRGPAPAGPVVEACDLCGEPLGEPHRHVLDREAGGPGEGGGLACACRACAILFDRDAAGGGRYRLVPERRRRAFGTEVDDAAWQGLGLPVGLAFFVPDASGTVTARFPSPAGPTEGLVPREAWARLVARAPALDDLVPEVEAFVVNRMRGRREHWVVPIDDAYRLVGLVRRYWEGFTGGDTAWAAIDGFFAGLGPDRPARTPPADGGSAGDPSAGEHSTGDPSAGERSAGDPSAGDRHDPHSTEVHAHG